MRGIGERKRGRGEISAISAGEKEGKGSMKAEKKVGREPAVGTEVVEKGGGSSEKRATARSKEKQGQGDGVRRGGGGGGVAGGEKSL